MNSLLAAVEAGGTKFVCGVGRRHDDIEEVRFPTADPKTTLAKVRDFLRPYKSRLAGIGVGSFGPVDLDPQSKTYGYITATPKPGWSNVDFVGSLKSEFEVPIGFDTDVNAAALGELHWGAGRGLQDLVYITVGTGVGGGVISGGKRVHGLVHPEIGHMFLTKHPQDDFIGHCSFHADRCLEGLCSGPALKARWQCSAEQLAADHPAWELQAFYLAQALASIICILSPQRIILGGGVMQQTHLLERIRLQTLDNLNGYVQHPALLADVENYIVKPGLGQSSGLTGAFTLAMETAGIGVITH